MNIVYAFYRLPMLPYSRSLYKIFLANQPTIEPASANASSARQIACIRTRGMPYYTVYRCASAGELR